jgi:hypothetical protein
MTMLRGAPADYAPVPEQPNIWQRVDEEGNPLDADGFVLALRAGQTVAQFFAEADAVAPPTVSDVNDERERRILAVSTITVAGYGDIPVSGDATTQLNLLALKDTARDLKAAGVTAAVIPFRDAANEEHQLTADQVIGLVDAGKQRVQAIYSASWTIKAMDPLPADVTDDGLWPN